MNSKLALILTVAAGLLACGGRDSSGAGTSSQAALSPGESASECFDRVKSGIIEGTVAPGDEAALLDACASLIVPDESGPSAEEIAELERRKAEEQQAQEQNPGDPNEVRPDEPGTNPGDGGEVLAPDEKREDEASGQGEVDCPTLVKEALLDSGLSIEEIAAEIEARCAAVPGEGS